MDIVRNLANAAAILVAGLIVAAAISFTFRWEIAGAGEHALIVDRWSGKIVVCNAPEKANMEAARNHSALLLDCAAP